MSIDNDPFIHSEIAGRDLDQARAMYEESYNGAGFTTELTDTDFAYRYTITGDNEMTLRSSMFLGSVQGAIQPENEYVVSWITGGAGVYDVGGDELPLQIGKPAMFPTGKQFAFEFTDYRQNLVHFNAGYLERIAAEEEGTLPGGLTFDHTAIPDDEALRQWRNTIARVAKTVLTGETTTLARAEVNREAAASLLRTFKHAGPPLPEALLAPRNARLRHAVEFMHSHAHLPITPTEIADDAGLSLRGLQVAFSRHLDVTPTDYLRGIRYERARDDLRNLGPRDTTVAAIAARWGFAHPGRFATGYARRFGESPSVTLQR
ncbi:helix-turn-helix transcriptional regulator [Frondihabitans cladoniiphilus]|uniref:HTH araC/xylS-type domain-containing protein n=1 Tax=Frondihabitans cladoniiphilus TaxID=715785 RepID=A0ABP8VZ97_9MICO